MIISSLFDWRYSGRNAWAHSRIIVGIIFLVVLQLGRFLGWRRRRRRCGSRHLRRASRIRRRLTRKRWRHSPRDSAWDRWRERRWGVSRYRRAMRSAVLKARLAGVRLQRLFVWHRRSYVSIIVTLVFCNLLFFTVIQVSRLHWRGWLLVSYGRATNRSSWRRRRWSSGLSCRWRCCSRNRGRPTATFERRRRHTRGNG